MSFNYKLFKVLANIKENFVIHLKSITVYNKKDNLFQDYLEVNSYAQNEKLNYILIFNSEGVCVFSHSTHNIDFNEEPATPPMDVEMKKDDTFGIWAKRYPWGEYGVEPPNYLRIVGETYFVNTSTSSLTIFINDEETYNYGECTKCKKSLHSNGKHIYCPQCGTLNHIT